MNTQELVHNVDFPYPWSPCSLNTVDGINIMKSSTFLIRDWYFVLLCKHRDVINVFEHVSPSETGCGIDDIYIILKHKSIKIRLLLDLRKQVSA